MMIRELLRQIFFSNLKTEEEVKEIIKEEIKRTRQSLPIVANYDPKNEGYRPLASYSAQRNLASIDQDRMIEIAYFMFDHSTMFKRLAKLDKTFLFSEKINIEAEDDMVQETITHFWNDPINLMDINLPDSIMWLGILGEQCWPVETDPITGIVHIGYLDPQDIKDIYVYKYNRRKLAKVELRTKAGLKGRKLQIIAQNINPDDKTAYGRLKGDCFYFSINHPPNAPRVRSDFLTLFDWIDALERYGFNYLERAEFMLNFVWDVTLKGLNEEEIRDWLKNNPPPEPGSIRAHNESVEWDATAPDLKAHDFTAGFGSLLSFLMGSHGRPANWYGQGGKVYQQEADLMGQVPIKDLDERQRLIKYIVTQLINYQIDQSIIMGKLPSRVNRNFEVNMPEISKRDLSRIAAVLPQIASSLEIAENRVWINPETASRFYLMALQQGGLDIDINAEIEQLNEERQYYIEQQEHEKSLQQEPHVGFHVQEEGTEANQNKLLNKKEVEK